jgi:hypothetical protein
LRINALSKTEAFFDTATSSGAAMSEHKDPHRTDCIKRTPLIAERLLLLQEVFEGTGRGASRRMAERLGVTLHRGCNVLRASPLGISLAQRIVLKFPGVSLDWLYLGRLEGLSCEIAEKLGYGERRRLGSDGLPEPIATS